MESYPTVVTAHLFEHPGRRPTYTTSETGHTHAAQLRTAHLTVQPATAEEFAALVEKCDAARALSWVPSPRHEDDDAHGFLKFEVAVGPVTVDVLDHANYESHDDALADVDRRLAEHANNTLPVVDTEPVAEFANGDPIPF